MKEWEIHMHDFVPADLLTYEIEPADEEVLNLAYIKLFLVSVGIYN
jgi:hypothetical protein